MNAAASPLHERLAAVRAAGDQGPAALWIEMLSPEEALGEARARPGPVFRLQEARALLQLERRAEAASLMGGLGELPHGLEAARRALLESTLSEKDGTSGGRAPRRAERALPQWLDRVQTWRKVLRV